MKALAFFFASSFIVSPVFSATAAECLKKVDAARTSLLAFKDSKVKEDEVHQTAKDVSTCLESLDAKGKNQKKEDAVSAWKAFRAVREERLVPAIKAGNKVEADKLATDNKANLDKTKNALNAISGD